eukprot:7386693-Prymnesium_polylepis.1
MRKVSRLGQSDFPSRQVGFLAPLPVSQQSGIEPSRSVQVVALHVVARAVGALVAPRVACAVPITVPRHPGRSHDFVPRPTARKRGSFRGRYQLGAS